MNSTLFAADIPHEIAARAHAGTSFVPDARGAQERGAYASTLAADFETLSQFADTDEKRATLEAEFSRYREGYRIRYLKWLTTKGRCVSTMIAGPSGFNVRRAEKANRVEDKRREELTAFRARALDAIRKTLCPELRPIMAGDEDATDRLREKLEKAETLQARMKSCNAAIRKHAKGGAESQVAALVALGLSEGAARDLLRPDFAGRIGFADYQITNNGAEVRRLRKRLEFVEGQKAKPTTETVAASGVRLEDCPAKNRVRLFFPGKPDEVVRAELKSRGFRWTPSLGCWQAYRTERAVTFARGVA